VRVFIPQDRAVESLNVAVAAAVCLFEQRRRHAGY
jgi:TrmH family RNA methyltransferase